MRTKASPLLRFPPAPGAAVAARASSEPVRSPAGRAPARNVADNNRGGVISHSTNVRSTMHESYHTSKQLTRLERLLDE